MPDCLDDAQVDASLVVLRIRVESDLLRHSAAAGEAIVPSSMYRGAVYRMLAECEPWETHARMSDDLL